MKLYLRKLEDPTLEESKIFPIIYFNDIPDLKKGDILSIAVNFAKVSKRAIAIKLFFLYISILNNNN